MYTRWKENLVLKRGLGVVVMIINLKFSLGLVLVVFLLCDRSDGDGVEVYNSLFHFPSGSPYVGVRNVFHLLSRNN